MRRAFVAMLLLLTGCTTPAPATLPPEDAQAVGSLAFETCEHQLGFFPIAPDEAAAFLPDGFAPASGTVPGQAELVVLTTVCEGLANATDGPTQEILVGIIVDPPAEVALADAELQFVYTALATTSPTATRAYAAWGLTAREGAEIVLDADGEPAATGEARADGATLRTAVAGAPSTGAAGAVRGFVVVDGALAGAVDFAFPEYQIRIGTATLEDPSGVSGFARPAIAGPGYHEFGEGYGVTLTRVAFNVSAA